MSDYYNIEEILEIACEIERNGARYYRRAIDVVSDGDAKQLLSELAAMEEQHLQTFATLRGDDETRAILLGEQGDVVIQYLQAVADSQIFPRDEDPSAKLSSDTAEPAILRTAISMEKESITFYLGLRDAMPEVGGRTKVDLIIREEMRHVTMLSNRLSALLRG